MIACAWGPVIGGMGTPAGAGANPLAIGFLKDIADYINSREKGEFYILRVAEHLSAKNYDGALDFGDISQAVDILAEQFPTILKTLSLPMKEKISDEKIII